MEGTASLMLRQMHIFVWTLLYFRGENIPFSVFTDTNFNGPYGAPGRYPAYPLDKVY